MVVAKNPTHTAGRASSVQRRETLRAIVAWIYTYYQRHGTANGLTLRDINAAFPRISEAQLRTNLQDLVTVEVLRTEQRHPSTPRRLTFLPRSYLFTTFDAAFPEVARSHSAIAKEARDAFNASFCGPVMPKTLTRREWRETNKMEEKKIKGEAPRTKYTLDRAFQNTVPAIPSKPLRERYRIPDQWDLMTAFYTVPSLGSNA